MAKSSTSWNEKLQDSKDMPKVVTLKPDAAKHWHAKTMVIPAPIEVDAIMKSVPLGKITTTDVIRQKLARKHKTDIACPLTTGIFAWIAAYAAEESSAFNSVITPYWRTLKKDGEINPKFPGGVEAQKNLLQSEGLRVISKGKRFFVAEYEKYLAD